MASAGGEGSEHGHGANGCLLFGIEPIDVGCEGAYLEFKEIVSTGRNMATQGPPTWVADAGRERNVHLPLSPGKRRFIHNHLSHKALRRNRSLLPGGRPGKSEAALPPVHPAAVILYLWTSYSAPPRGE